MHPTEEKHPEASSSEGLPSYNEALQARAHELEAGTDSKHPGNEPQDATRAPPTVDSPFSFPSVNTASSSTAPGPGETHYFELPGDISSPGSSSRTPTSIPSILAIPQVTSQPTSPFLLAYNTSFLLPRGIPNEAFTSFLTTLSAFLSANISDRALAHAAEVGRSLNSIPKKFSRDTVAHVKGVGRSIGESAKRGKIISAGLSALAGTVSIPVSAAFRVVDATLHQLPATLSDGLSKKPLSPRERAEAYVAVAQKDWFLVRGLSATLCDTAELVQLLKSSRHRGSGAVNSSSRSNSANEATVESLVNLTHRMRAKGAEGQLCGLQEFGLALLEVANGQPIELGPLDIGAKTLWLVMTDVPCEM
ncbi:hypothetical protein GGS21DRAFT_87459 [Xylaria nigripes]|nr:hypothetical protein GGS21DRAFT_87459 [Xylaria nigripes]